ncbi:unnamed protein product [Blepharisma stoltei]|uniref:Alpha-carbonic anhydrase domain-containing protein n=1 Tax=Blepharisma stoltei TaxID=1481888 RepID=A0AAU9K933_9CILI|nr:unnamed protein product [Blepharisma stoltei]
MIFPFSFSLLFTIAAAEEFSYCQSGADWDGLCEKGDAQSPINIITDSITHESTGQGILLTYTMIKAKGSFTDHNYQVTGNFVTGVFNSNNSDITGYGKQFHFHAPSEHTVNGVHYDLEMHSVQYNKTGSPIFVIGVLFQLNDKSNDFLEKVIDSYSIYTNIDLSEAFDGEEDLINFYYYQGSLTTPPCTEGINWFVWDKIQDVNQTQLDFFTSRWAGSSSFACGKGNNRLTQELHNRTVYRYDNSVILMLGVPIVALLMH